MNLERAIQIAAEAHGGQKDKAGEAYILHPLRVMLSVTGEDARIVAVLHDVVEDCSHKGWTFDRLRHEGMSQHLLDALASVTKLPEEADDYMKFVIRAGGNEIGRVVKISDLKDNLELSRISNPTKRDEERISRYRLALEFLESLPPTPSQPRPSTAPSWEGDREISPEEWKRAREERDAELDRRASKVPVVFPADD